MINCFIVMIYKEKPIDILVSLSALSISSKYSDIMKS